MPGPRPRGASGADPGRRRRSPGAGVLQAGTVLARSVQMAQRCKWHARANARSLRSARTFLRARSGGRLEDRRPRGRRPGGRGRPGWESGPVGPGRRRGSSRSAVRVRQDAVGPARRRWARPGRLAGDPRDSPVGWRFPSRVIAHFRITRASRSPSSGIGRLTSGRPRPGGPGDLHPAARGAPAAAGGGRLDRGRRRRPGRSRRRGSRRRTRRLFSLWRRLQGHVEVGATRPAPASRAPRPRRGPPKPGGTPPTSGPRTTTAPTRIGETRSRPRAARRMPRHERASRFA